MLLISISRNLCIDHYRSVRKERQTIDRDVAAEDLKRLIDATYTKAAFGSDEIWVPSQSVLALDRCYRSWKEVADSGDYDHRRSELLDNHLPVLLEEGVYHPDGQILDEVYAYGSFTQSKMYAREVRCADCHNVHSIRRVKEGNALCLQCHRAADYDTRQHHFHKQKGEKGDPIKSADGRVLFAVGTGAECVGCHMPAITRCKGLGPDSNAEHSFAKLTSAGPVTTKSARLQMRCSSTS